ncbi:MAG: uridine kinase [Planctomycetota bacterium]
MSWRVLVIGIAGGSGSGKSTLVQRLVQGPAGAEICHLCHDSYYHNLDRLPKFADGTGNWDHPESLENALFVADVGRLRRGEAVEQPVYDFATHRRGAAAETVQPRRILLLEGILLLAVPEIRELLDLKVFVETPADLRLLRRTLRDIRDRGRSVESVLDQYQRSVRPMHEEHVEPSRRFADIWIPWTEDNPAAVELLTARLCAWLQEHR